MLSLLIAVIYLSFISLGLPDGLLGAAWPTVYPEFSVPVSYAGIVSSIIFVGTVASSLMSDRLNRRLGTGLVTALSVLLTGIALLGFSFADSFFAMCLLAVPYGLGAGAVDAALNNYVALHYSSRHMSWLHCFWGVGASIGPYIMGAALASSRGWRGGYGTVSVIQLILTAVLFAALPLWKKQEAASHDGSEPQDAAPGLRDALKIRGVKHILTAFFCYCAFETTAGLWASTYLAESRNISGETAAAFASLFYLGITLGRAICGFIADRLGDKRMIRIGISVMLFGSAMIALPVKADFLPLAGLITAGLGCAPVYPAVIHSTPQNFGKENCRAIVGIQMASAYTGSLLMPLTFGLAARYMGTGLYPLFLAVLALLLLFTSEYVNRTAPGSRCR